MPEHVISKSRYIAGLQCPKLLRHVYNARDLLPPVDDATQAVFDQGHEVGLLAQKLFPGGMTKQGAVAVEKRMKFIDPRWNGTCCHGRVPS